jgi:hypothetical protein
LDRQCDDPPIRHIHSDDRQTDAFTLGTAPPTHCPWCKPADKAGDSRSGVWLDLGVYRPPKEPKRYTHDLYLRSSTTLLDTLLSSQSSRVETPQPRNSVDLRILSHDTPIIHNNGPPNSPRGWPAIKRVTRRERVLPLTSLCYSSERRCDRGPHSVCPEWRLAGVVPRQQSRKLLPCSFSVYYEKCVPGPVNQCPWHA